jgi:hypothetical protein
MIDVYSTDGEPQEFILDMGMSLKSVKVKFTFQEVDEKSYEIETYDVLPVDSGEQK